MHETLKKTWEQVEQGRNKLTLLMEGGVLQSRLEMSRTEIARNPKKTWEQVEQGRNKLTLRIEGGVLQSRLEMSETLEILKNLIVGKS